MQEVVLAARKHVEPGDGKIVFRKPVARSARLGLVAGKYLKRKLKPFVQFTLPLFHKASRADDKASLQVAAGDQFPDEQPRHDGFSGARIVGEQKTKRLPGQHGFVDCRDLVGERVHARRMHREHGVEQVGKANALRFGYEAEQRPVAIETPGVVPFD